MHNYNKILIIGSGAREHAIGWKIKKDNPNVSLFFAPGNAGTAKIGENIDAPSIVDLKYFALENKIDLSIVGPEAELVEGIVDEFKSENLAIFGPNKKAAQLEGSKAFAKEFMNKYGVKTAFSKTFEHFIDARDYVRGLKDFPLVIKASGLAAGKGVIIVDDNVEAEETLRKLMLDKTLGDAGKQVVIEEYLKGFEVSVLAVFNKNKLSPMLPVKDHKKIGEGDKGPNTGGMGVVAPNPLFKEEHMQSFTKDILIPTEKGLLEEGLLFSGVVFFGLMVTERGIYLLEYNMRFGDPETEALLPLMKNDLLEVISLSKKGEEIVFSWEEKHACCVVMASGGYPGNYQKGYEIDGLDKVDIPLFFAGIKEKNGIPLTSGGRVLNVVGIGNSLEEAREIAYLNIKKINFAYEYYREDIGEV